MKEKFFLGVLFLKRTATPIKTLGLLAVLMGIVDNLTYQFNIFSGLTVTPRTEFIEQLVQIVFIFCGLFALFGNGKTINLRKIIVSIPYFYLSILYTMDFLKGDINYIPLPLLMSLIAALWVAFFGEEYERTNY